MFKIEQMYYLTAWRSEGQCRSGQNQVKVSSRTGSRKDTISSFLVSRNCLHSLTQGLLPPYSKLLTVTWFFFMLQMLLPTTARKKLFFFFPRDSWLHWTCLDNWSECLYLKVVEITSSKSFSPHSIEIIQVLKLRCLWWWGATSFCVPHSSHFGLHLQLPFLQAKHAISDTISILFTVYLATWPTACTLQYRYEMAKSYWHTRSFLSLFWSEQDIDERRPLDCDCLLYNEIKKWN